MENADKISREHLLYLNKRRNEKIFIHTTQIALFVLFLAIWEISYRLGIIDGFTLSAPSRIFLSLTELFSSGEIYKHAFITLYETLLGFIIATVLGTVFALLLWWNTVFRRIMDPYVVVLNSLPKIALGPVIIIWCGSGTKSIVVMAILITVIVTTITMLNGFTATEESKILLMRSLGANKMQILTKLVLPSSLPTFISMLKINIGLSWIGSIMGEYLVSKAGLGYLIVYGGQVFKIDLVYAAMLVLCVLAMCMYALVCLVEKFTVRKK